MPTTPPPIQTRPITRYQQGTLTPAQDTLAQEAPIALVYNGISHAVIMATPQDIPQLALGFSISEHILQRPSQLYGSEIVYTPHGIEARLEIASECFAQLKQRRRTLNGRTGCGLCGIDSLTAAQPHIAPVTRSLKIPAAHINQALAQFSQHQPLRQQTGSLHAAAWVVGGQIQASYEDIGRHNALDKLIGHLVQHRADTQQGWLLLSSRASYEMIAKAASIGIHTIVAVSAATALAAQIAEQAHITLIGFAKPEKFTIYTHPQYITA
ncbi:formate dehydrogenase accessory sulfurtransferase FdhD [Kingella oralis]|uniref:formate dehydrogenase accessory sulfurtransferase FdhD n=1 Tax=Kingella oralis TaxID=505 RepID=UPI002D7FB98F|nr:formate dehydrogenase accessory sulfurtransferase FdhD [Kingella oralis]